ncbi:uncharacterized protein BP5553_01677 [Venustampulla echinocandica]|uniref:Major facilitator superfamily (MFS) profile domain-containing protein n=1 Tax=Venustampulla echinocandica TaxID=2656787 RepID=A0A370U1Q0_9HELO|nr:uncharacterized protein BP5553_01677 [Venustampulla echinocandica]RDL41698.1 hypothetical protein BP5553_01677 [Venustampulla echinocandica]
MGKELETDPSSTSASFNEKPLVTDAQTQDVEEGDSTPQVEEDTKVYLSGWRLYVVTIALCLSMFLPNFEVSIVSTSLLTITNELKGFSQSSWIVDAYLITYTGLLISWAKLSDIFGRKFSLLASLVIFMAFSGACGGAQTMTQLIIFRAFQGIGGSGIYALGMVIFFELGPARKYTLYAGLVTMTFTLALALGPIFGGLINLNGSWRWVFLLNPPAAFVAIIALAFAFPSTFPDIKPPSTARTTMFHSFSLKSIRKVDFLGTALLLGASIFLITALQQVENYGTWSSALTIALLVLSGPLLLAFLAWERRVTSEDSVTEPVFPWRFVKSRQWMGMIMNTFFCGTVFTVCIIQIPLRLQAVNGFSTLGAGVRLLPYGLLVPFGSFTAAALTGPGKKSVPAVYIILAGTTIQTVAVSLLSVLPTTTAFAKRSLAFEALAGLGTGLCIGSLVMLTPLVCEKRDLAVATAAINQFRFLGGSVGLAIVSSAMYSWTRTRFLGILAPDKVEILEQTTQFISEFSPEVQEKIRVIFAGGFNLQMKILIGLAALQFVATGLMWNKRPIR